MLVSPLDVAGEARVAVAIYGDVDAAGIQVLGEIANKKLGAAITPRWNFDKWRSYQSNVHCGSANGSPEKSQSSDQPSRTRCDNGRMRLFHDRADAGRQLAERLGEFAQRH